MTGLHIWWLSVLLGGPILALAGGQPFRRSTPPWALWMAGLGSAAVFGLAFSPLSLRGAIADHIVLGTACLVFWLLIGSGPRLLRWSVSGLYLAVVLLQVLRVWPILFLVFAFGDIVEAPFRTVALECGNAVEMRRYGWVAHSGTEVTVLALRAGGLIEVERGRQRFDDSEYQPSHLSADTPPGDPTCPVVVRYDTQEVWRVK